MKLKLPSLLAIILLFNSCLSFAPIEDSFVPIDDSNPVFDNIAISLHQNFLDLLEENFNAKINEEKLSEIPDIISTLVNEQKSTYINSKEDMETSRSIYDNLTDILNLLKDIEGFLNSQRYTAETVEYYLKEFPMDATLIEYSRSELTIVSELQMEVKINGIEYETQKINLYLKNAYGVSSAYTYDPLGYTDLFASIISSNIKPGKLYAIGKSFEVLQSVNGGSLLTCTNPYDYKTFTVFLYTKDIYADGHFFSKPILALSDGFYEYESLTGKKRVHSFKHIKLTDRFYFIL